MQMSPKGPWAINMTPEKNPHDPKSLIVQGFRSAAECFNYLEKIGVDHMTVLVDFVFDFYKDCNEGTCPVCGKND